MVINSYFTDSRRRIKDGQNPSLVRIADKDSFEVGNKEDKCNKDTTGVRVQHKWLFTL